MTLAIITIFVIAYLYAVILIAVGEQRGCKWCVEFLDGMDAPRRWLARLFRP